ncbi:MAG: hypothetical protein IPN01_23430 [Deltaproteobacteria bacterium]|nr:hypothetical protein [Deltaproteobacteria bacterium]
MIRAVLLDAAGTLISVVEPVGVSYARLAAPFGVTRAPEEIGRRFKAAMRAPWPGPRQRGDGRRFWRFVVAEATGSADPALFEAAYAHFAKASAWRVNPGVVDALSALRAAGLKLAVLSNWDTRLPGTLAALGPQRAGRPSGLLGGPGRREAPPRRVLGDLRASRRAAPRGAARRG